MQTRCPQCQTVSALEADRPDDKAGQFACPACGTLFDAYAHITDAAPDDAAKAGPGVDRDQGDLFATRARPVVPSSVPRFARERVRISKPAQWRWWLAGLFLLALLLAIVPIADRDELARDPDWRPRVEALCNVVGCRLAPWSEPTAFEVTAREFNPHPTVKGARLITVSFRNNARFAQTWPLLELTASDLNGRVVGLRRFRAQEYLGGAPEATLLQPGQSASATLEVVDPDAVSWDIEFR
ncbi:MAG TPA: zinc-ribbon and DUF3426 domain-containing protein [Xanthomonadaceae bacterium]|jgi:hypothetical protein